MIEAVARVEACDAGQLTLSWTSQSACGHCQQSDECGTGIVAKALVPKQNRLTMPSSRDYPVGTLIRVGIGEQDLLTISAAIYLLPLLTGILLAVLAQLAWNSEGLTILSALAGGGVGFLFARRWAERQPRPLVILGELGPPIEGA
ncbi:SoxR reducing system RseC family protein [Ferrimonas gelatinilytica]|uniref:SoxR reducing system RseC family protein n=1 Tax=Ferrimonas gelatinilytica TaxID=1255257 RepID=A0ABP9S836_9GAMM